MAEDGGTAWVVREWIAGRVLREIGDDLGGASEATLCVDIKKFIERWEGTDLTYTYGKHRKKLALVALRSWFMAQGEEPKQPIYNMHATLTADRAHHRARREHAFLLRCEGKKWREIGNALGVSRERARQMALRSGGNLARKLQRVKFTIIGENE